ncbi:MAG: chromosome segregation protein SMC [Tetrasphaera sp.]|nr:chromosome segregation protein SMC [Tetrasphaera sp.]
MFVKTLTLKGFKSFASATTLRLEPGVTCIVGPNGSGKSNVVDALAWVMGEQGAKSLRGGKMEDVIFAGTPGRAPLGRAEVAMTIDNTDGALPIDYTEVTISRTMFRTGGSEYAINGTPARLLDVQELLSDSGLGREMHVIVGQGQLDTVLRATPEERRGFIEEAAGVLKHRRRKERALRKLESMEGNLTRVADLTGEIRRQLGPLGRQAEAARRAAVIQAEARDARLRLLADDLVRLVSAVEQESADETALMVRRAEIEAALAQARARVAALEETAAAAAPALTAARDRWIALRSVRDRMEATRSLAAERLRLLRTDDAEETVTGRDPEELTRQAAAARVQEAELAAAVESATAALAVAVTAREAAEQAAYAEQQRVARLARAEADRREGLARLTGQVASRASRIEATEAELGRIKASITAARARAAEAEQDFAALEGSIAADEEGEEGLDAAYEAAAALHDQRCRRVDNLVEAERSLERERLALVSRLDALRMSLRRKDGAESLLAGTGEEGILGSFAHTLRVAPGHEVAVAAALGWAADAVAVRDGSVALAALSRLRAQDGGRAGLVVAGTPSAPAADRPPLPDGAIWARTVVTPPEGFAGAVDHLLSGVVLVPDLSSAQAVADDMRVIAVTPDGDLVGPGFARGGSADAPSPIELEAAVAEAESQLAERTATAEQNRFALVRAREELAESGDAVDAHLERLHESDARMAALAERLGALGAAIRAANAEVARGERSAATAREGAEAARAELAALTERLEAAQAEPAASLGEDRDDRAALEAAASAARAAETEARLHVRTTEERARAVHGRAASLEGAARNERAARERLRVRRERRQREAAVAQTVLVAAQTGVERLAAAAERAGDDVATGDAERSVRERDLATLREEVERHREDLTALTDDLHRDEIARAAAQAKIDQLRGQAVEELGIDPDVLVEDFGPHQPVPVVVPEGETAGEPAAYVRDVQEKRLRRAERGLRDLGRINPLALEEYAALEERHAFLTKQMEDLKSSRRDLLEIVKEVDTRVEQVFTEAFRDTAVQFERVFDRLFPGGEGRLHLTDPDNMLTTGIEVEARPPGKKIKRLSLLSGGERSLVAVALLVAIFKARPSPFYIMDEVEAALDDTNLGRLLTLFEELRDSSQLIVITHQKRTMEIADALYGVSMRGDGVTTVVSQRLRETEASA